MKVLITYDLHKRRVYTDLYELMAKWEAVRLCESVWLAELNSDEADVVRDEVRRTVDVDDTIAVIELQEGSSWATVGVGLAGQRWLSDHIVTALNPVR